ncbi:hypothetical protein N0Y54_42795 [Nostoc punctiforme UO1]|uniref:hypothetical protein n=1 Tax=Nostoc punctiforme TaxID=272131 RepID=UPI0030952B98
MTATQVLPKEKILQAMTAMIIARDWIGYLNFRRQLRNNYSEGFAGTLRHFYKSLPQEDLEAYINYFGDRDMLTKGERKTRVRQRYEDIEVEEKSERNNSTTSPNVKPRPRT